MEVCLWFTSSRQPLSAPWALCSQLTAVWYNMLRYIFEQRVFLCDTYVKYRSVWKCQQKFWHKFHDERVPSTQTTGNLVNKLWTTGLLIDKKTNHKCRVLTEEKFDDMGTRLEHTPRKSLKRQSLLQEVLTKVGTSLHSKCYRHAVSSARFACAPQQAAIWSPFSAQPWTP
jgi:hypothetical protein